MTVITGCYPFSVGACRSKLSVSLAKCFAIGPGPRNLKSARGLWQTLTDGILVRYHTSFCHVLRCVIHHAVYQVLGGSLLLYAAFGLRFFLEC